MVEIFRTDVCCEERAKEIISVLSHRFPGYLLNFDLDDCDKVLRAESAVIDVNGIIQVLTTKAVRAAVIE